MNGSKGKPYRRRSIQPIVVILALACVGTGVAVGQIKKESRMATARLEKLRRGKDDVEMGKAQLQLEKATLGNAGMVRQLVRQEVGMIDPKRYVIVPEDHSGHEVPALPHAEEPSP